VRVIQARDGPGLALEARVDLGVLTQVLRQDLDGDIATEARVARPVDFAHAAGPERRENFVGPETGTGSEVHNPAIYDIGKAA
jgi:hypothetical protein